MYDHRGSNDVNSSKRILFIKKEIVPRQVEQPLSISAVMSLNQSKYSMMIPSPLMNESASGKLSPLPMVNT